MDNNAIFSKTAKGLREATGATSELARSLRAVLKEVDGKKTFADLRQKFGKYSDADFQQAMRTLELEEYVRDTVAMTQTVVPFSVGPVSKRAQPEARSDDKSLGDLDFTQAMVRLDDDVIRAADEERTRRESAQHAELLALAKAKREREEKVRRESVERAKREAEVKAKQAMLAKARQEAEEQARTAALEKAKRDAEEASRIAAEQAARREAEEVARKEAEERTRREAEERARRAAAEKAKREAEERARKFAEERARQAAEARAKQEAEEKQRLEDEEKKRQAAIALARQEAEEKARRDAEEQARRAAEEKSRQEAAARKAAEEKARLEAEAAERAAIEAQRKAEAEAQARRDEAVRLQKAAEEKARIEAEAAMKQAAEAQARREAEEKARHEAALKQAEEERGRQEAEAVARKIAEEQARRDAEERARREAEERERRAAEAAALKAAEEETERRVAEEKARREAELEAQKAAHEAARLKEEEAAHSQQEAELRAQQEAEARVRREAEEEKVRLVVEARMKQEAEEEARREAEENARREAEEQARREAEAEAQRAAAAAVRAAEEEQARVEAEARQQKEAERLAAWERTKLKAEARLREEAEEKRRRDAEEKAQAEREAAEQLAEEARARAAATAAEHAEATKVAEQAAQMQTARISAEAIPAEVASKVSDRSELDMEPEERDSAALREGSGKRRQVISLPFGNGKGKEEDAFELRSLDDSGGRRKALQDMEVKTEEMVARMKARTSRFSDIRWGKVTVFVVIIVALAVARMHFESFDSRIPELKQMASQQFKKPVNIGAVYFSLFPRPQWQLEDVTIGDDAQAIIPVINATLDPGKILSSERWAFDSITLTAPTLNEEILAETFFTKSTAQVIKTKSISAKGVYIKSSAIDMPRFDVKAEIGPDGNWKAMTLDIANREVFVDMFPEADRVRFEATAITFQPPFGGTFAFNDFRAKGSFGRGELIVSEFEGRNFGGAFTGNAAMSWSNGWRMDGVVNAKQPNAKNLAPALVGSGHVDGKATFSMQAPDAKTLFAAPRLEGGFVVGEGTLLGVDLMSRLQNTTNTGKTQFRRLSGSFVREGTSTVFRQVRLDAGMLSASGGAVLDANNVLNGRFAANVSFDNQQRSAAVTLTGTLDKPRFSR